MDSNKYNKKKQIFHQGILKDCFCDETGNVDAVMDGALDPFINAYLKWISTGSSPDNE